MYKERTKGFISGIIVTLFLLTLITPAMADSIMKTISVTYDNIKLNIDDKNIEMKDANGNKVEPFIYNGTTYLPVRAVGEAIGKNVSWDSNTKTVFLTNKQSHNTVPVVTESYGRNNPAPINVTQSIDINTYSQQYTATITITEIIDGKSAWKIVEDANMFNTPAPEGKKYVLAKVQAVISSVKDDKAISLSSYNFTPFSGNNVEYTEGSYAAGITPNFYGDVYEGGVLEGYVDFIVDQDDTSPKVVFGQKYDGTGGIWFKLYE